MVISSKKESEQRKSFNEKEGEAKWRQTLNLLNERQRGYEKDNLGWGELREDSQLLDEHNLIMQRIHYRR